MSKHHKKIILSVWVEDKVGVLSHVTELFGAENCNIESLAVGGTEKPGVSRITITIAGDQTHVNSVISKLHRLSCLVKIERIDDEESILMELALIKVNAPDDKKTDIINIVNVFRARIVDVASESLTVAIAGGTVKILALQDLLRPFGITEVVRTGLIAIDRGPRISD